jgi:hypothetical protein
MGFTRTNRLAEAEEIQKRAYVLIEKHNGHFSADTAISLSNLATTYSLENKDDEAKRTAVEACSIATKALGAQHPLTRRCIRVLDGILGKGMEQAKTTAKTEAKTENKPSDKPSDSAPDKTPEPSSDRTPGS